jgi:hypothetical protein
MELGSTIGIWKLARSALYCVAMWLRWVLEFRAHYIAKGWSISCPWAVPLFRNVESCQFLLVRDNQDTGSVKIYRSSTRNNGVSLGSFFEKGLTHWSQKNMSATDSQTSQIYRGTPIGVALTRSLNAMIVSQQITGAAAVKIMVRLLTYVWRQSEQFTSMTIKVVF